MTIPEISCKQKNQIIPQNKQVHRVHNTATKDVRILMLCLGNNGNNLQLNIYAKVERPERKLIQVNTIEYVVKYYQLKPAISG